MNFIKRFLLINSILLSSNIILLSEKMAMGSWRTHISYSNITQITQSNNKVYGISSGSLFSIGKDDNIIEFYSKIYGLNDNNINLIKYSDINEKLFIAYENSNIDLISEDGEIFNITDIYRKHISGSKKINDIYFTEKCAYLACDFGITALDINKQEFLDTYMIGDNGDAVKVINVEVINDTIYALTTSNVLYAPINNTNLLNYQNWSKMPNPEEDKSNLMMSILDNYIYLLKEDNKLYKYDNNDWKEAGSNIKYINADNGYLFSIYNNGELSATGRSFIKTVADNANYAIYDENANYIWYSTSQAVYSLDLSQNESPNTYMPNGPASNSSWRLKYSNGRIFSVPGGRWAVNEYKDGSVSYYDVNSDEWRSFTFWDLKDLSPAKKCYDFVDVTADPNDNTHFWVASYGLGLYEFRNDKIYKQHNCDNSGIETIFPTGDKYNYIRTDGLKYDKDGNLWVLNAKVKDMIKYIDPDGNYHGLAYTELIDVETPQDILFSNKYNLKFVLMPRYTGNNSALFVFDDKNTPSSYDDNTRLFRKIYDQDTKEINFSPSNLRCITQDKDGAIWIGTIKGILVFNNLKNIFYDSYRCYRIKIPREDGTGLADYLLDTEEIKAIAVDGANRKWIGTASSGIYLVSEDGLKTIHHFTSDNSPLLSNAIQSIAINDKTGEVFIGTANGLISYQSDAIEGGNKFDNVHAYPNPVRPEYQGLVTITGVTDATTIRITDVNGYLVFETISNGGVATWDCCRSNGERVATGVYFAMCVSKDGKQKKTTKILIIN